ncbi:MAG: methyltransferase domain-containing protein [Chloroflexi bacterium]|nr:methyltransferase domain-containing protein [Chloroflexota bacterium]
MIKIINRLFRLLYNEFAWTYDLVAWGVSFGQWIAWGSSAISHLRGQRVLELAHGPGHLLVAMAERGLDPVGLDLSPHMGRLARRRLRQADLAVRSGLRQVVPLVQARAQMIPLCDQCVDSVVVTFPTEFIFDLDTLREIARVLCPGGRLVIVAWARLSGRDPLTYFVRWLYRVTGQSEPPPGLGEKLLKAVGFAPQVVWERIGRNKVMLIVADKQ